VKARALSATNASKRQRNSVAARCWFDRRRYSLITRLKKAKNWILWSIIVSVRQYIPEIGFCDGEGLFRRRNMTKWNSQTTTLKWVFIFFFLFSPPDDRGNKRRSAPKLPLTDAQLYEPTAKGVNFQTNWIDYGPTASYMVSTSPRGPRPNLLLPRYAPFVSQTHSLRQKQQSWCHSVKGAAKVPKVFEPLSTLMIVTFVLVQNAEVLELADCRWCQDDAR